MATPITTSTATSTIDDHARAWGSSTDISARSVLVTILGDTVAPLGGTVWLNDLFRLAAPFGFNERLVRTSMFRLVSERWVVNERVGRRSQYSLTAFGRDEFTTADSRIYRRDEPHWDGEWTMVFAQPTSDAEHEFVRLLQWRGFAELTRGVYASPTADGSTIAHLVDELAITPPLVASAQFDNLAQLAAMAPFQESSGLAAAAQAYRTFLDRFRWTEAIDPASLSDQDAFTLRTMIVHDLRRARLRDPDLPRDLLPTMWQGDAAMRLASELYLALYDASWRHVESVTDQVVDHAQPQLTQRFRDTNLRNTTPRENGSS